MAKKKKNDGKYFEQKSHEVIKKLNPEKNVMPNVHIVGKLSQSRRQLDVVMRDPDAYDFIAFECKDENGNIGTPTVEGYFTKLMDVGAKHGAIVSNTGYSSGAQNMADKLGIDLLNLVDSNDDKIKTKLIAEALLVRTQVTEWTTIFMGQLSKDTEYVMKDILNTTVRQPGEKNATIAEVAHRYWNDLADNNTDETPGTHVVDIDDLTINANHNLITLPTLRIESTTPRQADGVWA